MFKPDKVFVINLLRRPDRLAYFLNHCPLSDVEIIHAFDGKDPDNENPDEMELFHSKKFAHYQVKFPNEKMRDGYIGNWISHLRIWKRIVAENISSAVIFEDDPIFSSNFLDVFQKIDIEYYDIIYIGGRFHDQFTMPDAIPITETIVMSNGYYGKNSEWHDRTTIGYILSFRGAELLLDLYEKETEIDVCDVFLINSLMKLKIPIYSTNPLICWTPFVWDSDIR